MAPAKGNKKKKITETHRFTLVHKFSAGVSLLSLFTVIIAGIMAEVRTITMVYRAAIVMLAVGIITRIVVKAWAAFEENNSGET
jgi:hypothetical protein